MAAITTGSTDNGFYYQTVTRFGVVEKTTYWKNIAGNPGKLKQAAEVVPGCTYVKGMWHGAGSSRLSTIQFATPDMALYEQFIAAYKQVCKRK